MASIHDPIRAVVDHIEARGDSKAGHQFWGRWTAAQPALAEWPTVGEIAEACRVARGSEQDRILDALLRVAADDELAQLTVVAGLAGHLGRVLAGWAHAGAAAWELPGLGAELVSECWVGVSTLASALRDGALIPDRVALHLVDVAREAVRVPRRRELRAAARRAPCLDSVMVTAATRPTAELLAAEIADAVHRRRITIAAATPVFLTRVIGLEVAEAAQRLGCSAAVVRAIRSRAERRLVAA